MTSRRAFLGTTALSASRVLGANDRVRIGLLGAGGRGSYIANLAREHAGAELAAVCDAYEPRLTAAQAPMFRDYRAVLDLKDIDAVVVGAPDHWHVPMTIAAVQAGKDVYVEKPLTHSVEEGDAVIDAVRRSGRIVQVGYQQRSYPHFAEVREMIRGGALGRVTLVNMWWHQPYSGRPEPKIDVSKLDWKQFLGSAPPRPFAPWRFAQWRFFWDYGGGSLTDLFSHWIDAVHWILDDSTPITAQGLGQTTLVTHWETPDTLNAALQYSKGWTATYDSSMVTRVTDGGIVFFGSGGSLRLDRGGYQYFSEKTAEEKRTSYAPPDKTAKAQRDGTIDHVLNWIDCIKTRKAPNAGVESSVAAANAAHYGNRAIRTGKLLHLPPRAGQWRPLFNGRDLDGWVQDTPGVWTVGDGMIVGKHAGQKWNDFLRTREHFEDFELKAKFRLMNGEGNSGIQFRSTPAAIAHEVSGYQADVGQQYWGALYDESRRNRTLVMPEKEMLASLDRTAWNEYTIRADGRHIAVTLNGIRTVDYTEADPAIARRGLIALQVHSGPGIEVRFRDVEIREL